jgi:hypothetical protein
MSLIDRVQTNEELSRRCHRTCSHVPFATEFSFSQQRRVRYLRFGQLSVRQLYVQHPSLLMYCDMSSRYHSVRAVGLDRELTKTFSRRLHWRDLA